MSYVVKMPKLGLEMEQGTVLEWHVDEGESVEEDDVLVEVESEKSIGEVEAREAGVLRVVALDAGESVPPGTPIGIVAPDGDDITDLEAQFDADGADSDSDADDIDEGEAEGTAATGGSSREGTSTGEATATTGAANGEVKASPRAKRRAEELDVSLASVEGTGPQNAITASDVDDAAASADATTDGQRGGSSADSGRDRVRASPRAKERAEERGVDLTTVEGTGPQNAITASDVDRAAEDATEATDAAEATADRQPAGTGADPADRYHTTALVTDSQDAETLIEATRLAGTAFDLDVSALDVLLVTVSAALSEHPIVNATLEDDTHHCHEHQHVSLTIDGHERVVTNVADRSFADLLAVRQGDAEKDAAENDEARGPATFALATGSDLHLEAPTVAGLAVDASRRRAMPVGESEGVSLDRYLSLSLSYDPRAVGAADARAFLEGVLDAIERAPELVMRTYR